MVARERYWEEMSIEQKLDHLAFIVDHQYRNWAELSKQLTLLSKHSHSQEGDILVPIKDKEYALESGRQWSPINRQPRV